MGLAKNKYIINLNLRKNRLKSLGGKAIGVALRTNNILEELDLSFCLLDEEAGIEIAKGIKNG